MSPGVLFSLGPGKAAPARPELSLPILLTVGLDSGMSPRARENRQGSLLSTSTVPPSHGILGQAEEAEPRRCLPRRTSIWTRRTQPGRGRGDPGVDDRRAQGGLWGSRDCGGGGSSGGLSLCRNLKLPGAARELGLPLPAQKALARWRWLLALGAQGVLVRLSFPEGVPNPSRWCLQMGRSGFLLAREVVSHPWAGPCHLLALAGTSGASPL